MKDAIKMISLDDIGDMRQQPASDDTSTSTSTAAAVPAQANIAGVTRPPRSEVNFRTSQGTAASPTGNSFLGSISKIGMFTGSFQTNVTGLTQALGGAGASQRKRLIILGAGFLLVLLGLVFYFSGSDSAESDGSAASLVSETVQEPEAKAPEAQPTTPSAAPAPASSPYDRLPNPLEIEVSAGEKLSPDQESRWRNGLSHPFNYQRFRTVQEARLSRMKGSEFILNDALAQGKFWTRMEALLGMVELGQEIEPESMRTAVGDARPPLVANYFRRFRRSSDELAQHVQRAALGAAPERARLVILENLSQRRGPINDLFLVAGSKDPDSRVRAFAEQELSRQAPSAELMAQYEQYQSGALTKPAPKVLPEATAEPAPAKAGSAPEGTPPQLSPVNVKEMKVEELPSEVNVEEVYYLDGDKNSGENKAK